MIRSDNSKFTYLFGSFTPDAPFRLGSFTQRDNGNTLPILRRRSVTRLGPPEGKKRTRFVRI